MNVTHGMDPREVRALGHDLQGKADELRRKAQLLDRLVNNAYWTGPEAARFKYQWWPAHRSRMWSVANDLDGFGQSALNNAADQERASRAGSQQGRGSARVGAWGRSGAGSSDVWIRGEDADEFFHLIGDIGQLPGNIRDVNRLIMLGNSRLGMQVYEVGSDGWHHFRGAAGGYTAALNQTLDVNLHSVPYIDIAVSGGTVMAYGVTTGWGSTETAVASVEGVLDVGAGFVPGGFVALEVGERIGTGIYDHTPFGSYVEGKFLEEDHATHDRLISQWDEAFVAGDYERANTLANLAQQKGDEIMHESTGWTGLWNATTNTLLDSWADPLRGLLD